mgnify:FL=1
MSKRLELTLSDEFYKEIEGWEKEYGDDKQTILITGLTWYQFLKEQNISFTEEDIAELSLFLTQCEKFEKATGKNGDGVFKAMAQIFEQILNAKLSGKDILICHRDPDNTIRDVVEINDPIFYNLNVDT